MKDTTNRMTITHILRNERYKMSTEERLERIEKLLVITSKEVLNVSETAMMLGVSESRVRHMMSSREIPYYKRGVCVSFKKSEIEAWRLDKRFPTDAETKAQAATYVTTHPLPTPNF